MTLIDQEPLPTEPDADVDELVRRLQRSRAVSYVATGVLIALIAAGGFIPVPYVKLSPGPLYNTIGSYNNVALITITGTKTYPTSGKLDLVTVTERGGPYGGLTLPEALIGWIDPDQRVVPTEVLYPLNTTAQEAEQQNEAQFTSSQSAAVAAALHYLKIPVTVSTIVAWVESDGPSAGKLHAGDVVKSVAGKEITSPEQVAPIVRSHAPGSTINFVVERDNQRMTIPVVLAAQLKNPTQGRAGIQLGAHYAGPFTITFGLSDVGGPSAGTMFALGLIDKLTPGSLNGGRFVAGTGTISPDGSIGAIGGIAQKLAAAKNNRAELFLVPSDNCDQVVGNEPADLEVIKVSTISEAVDAITKWKNGDHDLPHCTEVPTQK